MLTRATMGHFIANKSVQKLFKIGDNLALTMRTGWSCTIFESNTCCRSTTFELKRQTQMTVKGAATLTANILVGSLTGSVANRRCRCLRISRIFNRFSGRFHSRRVLRNWFRFTLHVWCSRGWFQDNMSRDEEEQFARALNASGQRDAASGNGMDLAVINAKDGYVAVEQTEISRFSKK